MRSWFKLYEGTTDDPKFRLVAKLANCSISVAIAIWIRLLERACEQKDGNIDGYNYAVSDIALDLEAGTTGRVVGSMVDVGLIEDGRIAAWDRRQSTSRTSASAQKESGAMTDAERQRKRRARLKEEASRANNVPEESKESNRHGNVNRDTDCHSVTQPVTPCHANDLRDNRDNRDMSRCHEDVTDASRDNRDCHDVTNMSRDVTGCHDPDKIRIEEMREEEKEKEKYNTSTQPSQTASCSSNGCVAITLPTNTGDEYPVYETQVEKWQQLYPAVDVRQELRSMRGWCDANPTKCKTSRGMPRFVNGWLAKRQNQGGVLVRSSTAHCTVPCQLIPGQPTATTEWQRSKQDARLQAQALIELQNGGFSFDNIGDDIIIGGSTEQFTGQRSVP